MGTSGPGIWSRGLGFPGLGEPWKEEIYLQLPCHQPLPIHCLSLSSRCLVPLNHTRGSDIQPEIFLHTRDLAGDLRTSLYCSLPQGIFSWPGEGDTEREAVNTHTFTEMMNCGGGVLKMKV